jgi:hypothetical protein
MHLRVEAKPQHGGTTPVNKPHIYKYRGLWRVKYTRDVWRYHLQIAWSFVSDHNARRL